MFTQVNNDLGANSEDKRYMPRWEVNKPIYCYFDESDVSFKGETVDLSCAGTCIAIDQKLEANNQKIRMMVYLNEEEKVEVNGKVMWSNIVDGRNEIGVKFFNVDTKVQESIFDHSYEVDRENVVNHWFEGWSDSK